MHRSGSIGADLGRISVPGQVIERRYVITFELRVAVQDGRYLLAGSEVTGTEGAVPVVGDDARFVRPRYRGCIPVGFGYVGEDGVALGCGIASRLFQHMALQNKVGKRYGFFCFVKSNFLTNDMMKEAALNERRADSPNG